jgi:hypothetical protein
MLLVTVKLNIRERKVGEKMEGLSERKRKDKNREETKRKEIMNRRNKQFSGKNEGMLQI